MASDSKTQADLTTLMEKAADFHGHLGPFLVIGVRMGIIGIRELGLKNSSDGSLRITAHLRCSVPFSCIVDGLQTTTKCTIGNQKLELVDSPSIAVKFGLHNGKKVTITLNPATYNRLESQLLSKNSSPEEVERLAQQVASMSEEKLLIVRRNF